MLGVAECFAKPKSAEGVTAARMESIPQKTRADTQGMEEDVQVSPILLDGQASHNLKFNFAVLVHSLTNRPCNIC